MRSALCLALGLLLMFGVLSYADEQAPRRPAADERCPVCGMYVAPYPEWIATAVLEDGSQLFFDGSKDMFRYYFHRRDAGYAEADQPIRALYATDYYSTQLMPVEDLFFVLGSDVYGPMGHELIPVAGREQAETFLSDHQGTRILRFSEVTPADLPQN